MITARYLKVAPLLVCIRFGYAVETVGKSVAAHADYVDRHGSGVEAGVKFDEASFAVVVVLEQW